MGTLIVRLTDGLYVHWSNTTDSPVSPVLTRAGLVDFLVTTRGVEPSDAEQLLRVADDHGISDPDWTRDELLAANRAGENEEWLTVAQILELYAES